MIRIPLFNRLTLSNSKFFAIHGIFLAKISSSTSDDTKVNDIHFAEKGRTEFYDALVKLGKDRDVRNYFTAINWHKLPPMIRLLPKPQPQRNENPNSCEKFPYKCICGQPCRKIAYLVHKESHTSLCVCHCCMHKADPTSLRKKCLSCNELYRGRYDYCPLCRERELRESERKRQDQENEWIALRLKEFGPNMISFGKYKGEHVDSILEKDKRWCLFVLRKAKRTSINRDSLETIRVQFNEKYDTDFVTCSKCGKCYKNKKEYKKHIISLDHFRY